MDINTLERPGIPTGFADLDHMTNGLHPGQMTVVTGPPGIGKTTAVTTIARNASVHAGHSVAMFTRELSKPELMQHLTASQARVSLHRLRGGMRTLDDADLPRLKKAGDALTAAPLHIFDTSDTVEQIRKRCQGLQTASTGLDLVVIDSPFLLYGRDRNSSQSREEEVAEISRDMKSMAMDLNVAVLVSGRQSRRPESMLNRQWSALEMDADLVIQINREDAYDVQSSRLGEADMSVTKHRNGPTGTIIVAHQFHYARFVDFAHS